MFCNLPCTNKAGDLKTTFLRFLCRFVPVRLCQWEPSLEEGGRRKESLCFWQGLFRRKFRSSGSTLANREAVTAASAIQTLAALAPSADLWVLPPCSLGNTFSAFCSFKSRPVVVSWSLGNCFPSYASSDLPHNFVTNSLLLNPPLRLMCGRNQHNIVKQLSSN